MHNLDHYLYKQGAHMNNFDPGNGHIKINGDFYKLTEDQTYWLHEKLFQDIKSQEITSSINLLMKECTEKLNIDCEFNDKIKSDFISLTKLSEKYFDWVSIENIRQIALIQHHFEKLIAHNNFTIESHYTTNNKIYGKFTITVLFDKYYNSLPEEKNINLLNPDQNKKAFISDIKMRLYKYERFSDKFFVWLKKLDKEGLLWCYKYIKNKEEKFPYSSTINEISPTDVIILIDQINFTNDDAFTLYTERLKRSFAQHKYKSASKTKNKYHLPLTKQAKKILNELAEYRHQSESDVLEDLLMREYKQKMCDPQGNPKF